MIAPETARSACEAVWLAMVELAETANHEVVSEQRSAHATATTNIAAVASDLAALAVAAAVLARHLDHAS